MVEKIGLIFNDDLLDKFKCTIAQFPRASSNFLNDIPSIHVTSTCDES